MISWIKGDVIDSWEYSHRLYVLLNCQGIGYEIQVLQELPANSLNKELILWIHHVKREDSDSFFGFKNKEERDLFRELLLIKGIGPQIGMNLLKRYKINEIMNSIVENNKDLISSVPGIGQKMTERIFLELKNKYKKFQLNNKSDINHAKSTSSLDCVLEDVEIALNSLEYSKKEIAETLKVISSDIKKSNLKKEGKFLNINFEEIFKEALAMLNRQ